jgi:hypothetical protein
MWQRLLELVRRRRLDRDLDQEFGLHLEMIEAEFRQRGMSASHAQAAARREFGGVMQAKERYRDERGLPWLENFAQDLRYGLRIMRQNRGFTTVAIVTLALGIGANTAIFSLLEAVELRNLPLRQPEQLIALQWTAHRSPHGGYSGFTGCDAKKTGAAAAGCSFCIPSLMRFETKRNPSTECRFRSSVACRVRPRSG